MKVVSRVLCAQMVGATSSEGFLGERGGSESIRATSREFTKRFLA